MTRGLPSPARLLFFLVVAHEQGTNVPFNHVGHAGRRVRRCSVAYLAPFNAPYPRHAPAGPVVSEIPMIAAPLSEWHGGHGMTTALRGSFHGRAEVEDARVGYKSETPALPWR